MKILISTSTRKKSRSVDQVVSYTGSTKQVAKKTIAYLKESEASVLSVVSLDTLKWVIKDLQVAVKSGDENDLQHAVTEIDSTFYDEAHILDQDGAGGAIVIRKRLRRRR